MTWDDWAIFGVCVIVVTAFEMWLDHRKQRIDRYRADD